MKKISILLMCAFTLGSCCNMKKLQRQGNLEINPTTLDLEANSADNPVVDIKFDLTVPENHVPKKSQLLFQPQFLTVSNYYNLQPVVINGKKMARKEAKMVKKGESLPYSGSVRVESGKDPVTVKYDVSTSVYDWMPESELIGWTLVNCGKKYKEEILSRQLIAASIKIPEKEAATAPNVVTEQTVTQNAVVETTYFVINSSNLDVALSDNAQTMQTITALINKINNEQKLKLTSVNIVGSASPEGTEKTNSKLALDRANMIAGILEKDLAIDKSLIKVSSVGANWKGFVDLVRASSLPNKNDIIAIANGSGTDLQKSVKLRMLYNYDVLKKDYLPHLRMVRCDFSYSSTDSVSSQIVVY